MSSQEPQSQEYDLQCPACGWQANRGAHLVYRCPDCGGPLDLRRLTGHRLVTPFPGEGLGLWRYSDLLAVPFNPSTFLGEGRTPLLKSRRLGRRLGLAELYFKCDHLNPTGSFKDREVAGGVNAALAHGQPGCVTSSSGNAGSSLAAYCARAGLACVALVPSGTAPAKVAQMMAHGANVVAIDRASDDAEKYTLRLQFVHWLAERWGWFPAITARRANPFMVEGAKTIAHEVCEDLGWRSPEAVFLPVGGGGLAGASWLGFRELAELGLTCSTPKLVGVQAAGASTVARAVREGLGQVLPVRPGTRVSGIAAPLPYDGDWAVDAIRQSGGGAVEVTDDEVDRAMAWLAEEEGLYVEPAGAASVAGLIRWVEQQGSLAPEEPVVCFLTGHGLKKTVAEGHQPLAELRRPVTVDIDEIGRAVARDPKEPLPPTLDRLEQVHAQMVKEVG